MALLLLALVLAAFAFAVVASAVAIYFASRWGLWRTSRALAPLAPLVYGSEIGSAGARGTQHVRRSGS
jgi:hypothetical protein